MHDVYQNCLIDDIVVLLSKYKHSAFNSWRFLNDYNERSFPIPADQIVAT